MSKKDEVTMVREIVQSDKQNKNAGDSLPVYSVPREKALIKAKKQTGFFTLIIGLILWYFNSDRK